MRHFVASDPPPLLILSAFCGDDFFPRVLCSCPSPPGHVCFGPVDHRDDGRFYHQVMLEIVEVEELPPVFAAEEIRLEMSSRFKLEGNEKFTAGDYSRSESGVPAVL